MDNSVVIYDPCKVPKKECDIPPLVMQDVSRVIALFSQQEVVVSGITWGECAHVENSYDSGVVVASDISDTLMDEATDLVMTQYKLDATRSGIASDLLSKIKEQI